MKKKLRESGYSGIKINLITVSTPTDNTLGSPENPATYGDMINQHTHIYNQLDIVQNSGANIMDFLNPTTVTPKVFGRVYNNSKTINKEVDVSSKYSHFYQYPNSNLSDRVAAHSFDVESNLIQKDIDSGKIDKQN